jgi:hypothetical protein
VLGQPDGSLNTGGDATAMMNRIGKYSGEFRDVQRAAQMLAFCDAILEMHDDFMDLSRSEFDSLNQLRDDALSVLRQFNIPLPEDPSSSL